MIYGHSNVYPTLYCYAYQPPTPWTWKVKARLKELVGDAICLLPVAVAIFVLLKLMGADNV